MEPSQSPPLLRLPTILVGIYRRDGLSHGGREARGISTGADIKRLLQMDCRAAAGVFPLVLPVGGVNRRHGPLSGTPILDVADDPDDQPGLLIVAPHTGVHSEPEMQQLAERIVIGE